MPRCVPALAVAQIECEEGLFNMEINGDGGEASVGKLRMISRQLTWAKRALIWANGSIVKAVRIEKMEEDDEG